MMKHTTLTLLLILLAACGGNSCITNPPDILKTIKLTALEVSLESRVIGAYTDFNDRIIIDCTDVLIASSVITFTIELDDADPAITCRLLEQDMVKVGEGSYVISIQAAYFKEALSIRCFYGGLEKVSQSVGLIAYDPQVVSALNRYLTSTNIPVHDDSFPEDPYSGYRRDNYYEEIHRFIMAGELYSNPQIYGIENHSDIYNRIENYLINSAESFFEPCTNYDFGNGEPRQCRSPERIGKYYFWRSPTYPLSLSLAKVEWRAAAGVAQAIKAILLEHPGNNNLDCPISNEPSSIRDSSLTCRALNIRRLLKYEIWDKWNDDEFVQDTGWGDWQQYTMKGAIISHYIAWIEFIVDLFQSTDHIAGSAACADCVLTTPITSRADDLLDYYVSYGDDYITGTCSSGTTCLFHGNPFEETGSIDIAHYTSTMHYISMYDNDEFCDSSQDVCISMTALARSMNDETWIDDTLLAEFGVGFPKFDIFMNGYCSKAVKDQTDVLFEFCSVEWLYETGDWPGHKNLFGLVNLGKYNRDLMIKLRQATDENNDGVIDEHDSYRNAFIVMLFKSLAINI